jgi:hypothetical protein
MRGRVRETALRSGKLSEGQLLDARGAPYDYKTCSASPSKRFEPTSYRRPSPMTPAEFLSQEKDEREVFDWILRLVPPNSAGSSLARLPDEIIKQLSKLGIDGSSVPDAYRDMVTKIDWAKDAYARLIQCLPAEERAKLKPSELLVVGAINDAEYNGFVQHCKPGFAICISTGALMLIYFAAELYCLNESAGFQRTVISGDYDILGWQDRQEYRSMRTLRYRQNEKTLDQLYPKVVARELEFLFKNYAHLGVAGEPSFYKQLNCDFGYRPLFPELSRFGHPLEAGSHLAEHAIRFLLLHECGHILENHFDRTPSHRQELDADRVAFELGVRSARSDHGIVASLLGAWLVLAIARRIEAYGDTGANSSHPPARERLAKLLDFIRSTDLIGCFTRHRALYYLRDLERRDALLVDASGEYRQMVKEQNSIALLVGSCVFGKSDVTFMDQIPRWVLQFPPVRFFSSLAAARVGYETELRQNPDNSRALFALKMIMKVYDAAGNNTASTLDSRLQNAYLAEVHRST